MIYLFGTGEQVSVVYQPRSLTEENKARATLVVEKLPEKEEREGYYSQLYIDPDTKQVSYVYRKIDVEQEVL